MSLVKRQKTDNTIVSALKSSSESKSSILYHDAVILEGHDGPVLAAKFSSNGQLVASGGMDKNILLWSLPTQESDSPNYGVMKGHKSSLTSIGWNADDTTIVTSSADTTIGFWDVETGKRIRKCIKHDLVVNEVHMSNDLAVSAGDDGFACIWDQRYKTPVIEIQTDYPLLTSRFDSQAQTIFVAGIDPTILAYDIRSPNKPLWTVDTQSDSLTSLSIKPDNSALIARSMDGTIKTVSSNHFVPEGISRLNLQIYDGAPSGNQNYLIRTSLSHDNMRLASGSEDQTVTIWDYNTRKLLKKLSGHKGTVIDVDYHPTENIILSTSNDGTVILWEL